MYFLREDIHLKGTAALVFQVPYDF